MQGREKEICIFTTVRSNPRRRIGFVADPRRINVGLRCSLLRSHLSDRSTQPRNFAAVYKYVPCSLLPIPRLWQLPWAELCISAYLLMQLWVPAAAAGPT